MGKENGVRRLKESWKQKVLWQWIVSGSIVLMIPIICAMVNFFINKNLLERKINQITVFMLENIQYNLDQKLEDLKEVSTSIQYGKDFHAYSFQLKNEQDFIRQANKSYQELKAFHLTKPELDILMYLPERKYIIDSATANRSDMIYNTLMQKKRISVPQEEWENTLGQDLKAGFRIAEDLSYTYYGRECFVYAALGQTAGREKPNHIYVSTPTDFIKDLFSNDQEMENSFLILDKENHILASFGKEMETEGLETVIREPESSFHFRGGKEEYIGIYAPSAVSGWKYAVFTPESVYMDELNQNRRWNLFIVFLGSVIGMTVLILIQRKNYRPLGQIIKMLPHKEEPDDEFRMVEMNLKKLYQENSRMKNSIENRREYDKELFLLSCLKGRKSIYQNTDILEELGIDTDGKVFALATLNLDVDEESIGNLLQEDFPLLEFSIHNVMEELFEESPEYLKTTDDLFFVYLFVIDEDEGEEVWHGRCRRQFQTFYEFFQKYYHAEIAVTMGGLFPSLEEMEAHYEELQTANGYRYSVEPCGVMLLESLKDLDFTMAERLKMYNRRFEEVLGRADYPEGKRLGGALFEELREKEKEYSDIQYFVLAIVNDLLIMLQADVREEMISRETLAHNLDELRAAANIPQLQEAFMGFLKKICRTMEEDTKASTGISEVIREYVDAHYMDCTMNISSIAESVGMTSRYVSKLFKDQTGNGLLNYINGVRISHAMEMLKNTKKTVDEIAEECGFTNARTFRRNFQKMTGQTAADFRTGKK
ncbi:MAG: helix-turn-helix domain-containing protein [Lachnospiraceae bacterium]|nr:helix-turn-helix domain-containing protein [Lachnospiraceae bacterium]